MFAFASRENWNSSNPTKEEDGMEHTPKTDTEIAIRALAEWPEEARPLNVFHSPKTGSGKGCFADTFHDITEPSHVIRRDHAIALFVAAGIEYLLERDRLQTLARGTNTYIAYRNASEIVERGLRPTLFAAIDTAIRNKGDKP